MNTRRLLTLGLLVSLIGCSGERAQPINDLNALLRQSTSSRREPALGVRWLASLSRRQGREREMRGNTRQQSDGGCSDHEQPAARAEQHLTGAEDGHVADFAPGVGQTLCLQ